MSEFYFCKTQTPWGRADTKEPVIRGINWYSTPSHGGLKVSKKLNEEIPIYVRKESGWYEANCEWSIVALSFPEYFENIQELAHKTFRNWYPEKYEVFTGTKLKAGESYMKDKDLEKKEEL